MTTISHRGHGAAPPQPKCLIHRFLRFHRFLNRAKSTKPAARSEAAGPAIQNAFVRRDHKLHRIIAMFSTHRFQSFNPWVQNEYELPHRLQPILLQKSPKPLCDFNVNVYCLPSAAVVNQELTTELSANSLSAKIAFRCLAMFCLLV